MGGILTITIGGHREQCYARTIAFVKEYRTCGAKDSCEVYFLRRSNRWVTDLREGGDVRGWPAKQCSGPCITWYILHREYAKHDSIVTGVLSHVSIKHLLTIYSRLS